MLGFALKTAFNIGKKIVTKVKASKAIKKASKLSNGLNTAMTKMAPAEPVNIPLAQLYAPPAPSQLVAPSTTIPSYSISDNNAIGDARVKDLPNVSVRATRIRKDAKVPDVTNGWKKYLPFAGIGIGILLVIFMIAKRK